MQAIKRVDPISAMKVSAVLYAALGVIIGAILSLISMMGFLAAAGSFEEAFGFLFGAGAIIILPIIYGVLGAIVGLIGAALYNLAAKFTGGLGIELG